MDSVTEETISSIEESTSKTVDSAEGPDPNIVTQPLTQPSDLAYPLSTSTGEVLNPNHHTNSNNLPPAGEQSSRDHIFQLLQENPRKSLREIALLTNTTKETVRW